MRITTLTGSLTLLLVSAVALTGILPAVDKFQKEITLPVGTIAGVSLGGTVEATPTNTLYAELQKREGAISKKEQDLKAQEAYLNKNFDPTPGTIKFLYLLVVALFVLVVVNFLFDIKRHHKESAETAQP